MVRSVPAISSNLGEVRRESHATVVMSLRSPVNALVATPSHEFRPLRAQLQFEVALARAAMAFVEIAFPEAQAQLHCCTERAC